MKIYNNLQQALIYYLNSSDSNNLRFQKKFAEFAASVKNDIVVETGSGISTLFLLLELKNSKIYSVDFEPWSMKFDLPNYKLIENKKSEDYLFYLFQETGPWDIFLHDSDHEIRCMSYELELAYGYVNPGGYIACDDRNWGSYGVFNDFVDKYNLEYIILDSLAITQKPYNVPICADPYLHWKQSIQIAEEKERILKNEFR